MDKVDIARILGRMQEEFDADDITPDTIADWLAGHDERGKTQQRRNLGTMLSNIFQKERQIARSFTIGSEFAKQKGIILNETTKAFLYPKFGGLKKEAIVIRRRGKFVTWRYV